jgi:hypothetical protein
VAIASRGPASSRGGRPRCESDSLVSRCEFSGVLRRVADDARPPIAHTTRPESYFDSDKRLLQPILSEEGALIAIERNAVRSRVRPHMSHACGSPEQGALVGVRAHADAYAESDSGAMESYTGRAQWAPIRHSQVRVRHPCRAAWSFGLRGA